MNSLTFFNQLTKVVDLHFNFSTYFNKFTLKIKKIIRQNQTLMMWPKQYLKVND